ncbi:hypothetical protein FSP39_011337 [Pinctada imbricata]|uniref:CUB domain-containing protein n=1 Tax=Pinctada imbricata TaxID=66713 RepID=A0AA88YNQ3_PINIB|nr:hypothetical protein FSP39_011337 [Pinctada imbricata]
MDDTQLCKPGEGIHVHPLAKGDVVYILSRKKESDKGILEKIKDELKSLISDGPEKCAIVFSPPNDDKSLQFLSIHFQSFRIGLASCDTKLQIVQSPANFFDRDVSEMASLTCRKEPEDTYITEKGNNMKVIFSKSRKDSDDYSFSIKLTLSKGDGKDEGISMGVKIGIAVLATAVFLVLIILVIKIIKLRMSAKDDLPSEDGARISVNTGTSSRTRSNSYTPTPDAENLIHNNHPPPSYEESHEAYTMMAPQGGEEQEPPYCPPSYDEALEMAKLSDDPDPMYANVSRGNKT